MTHDYALLNLEHPVRKPIMPYAAFVNGKKATATAINVVSVSDNLFDHVVFKYTLYDENGHWAGEGAYELRGADYSAWNDSPDDAFQTVADGLGVVFEPSVSGDGRDFFGLEIE